MSWLARIRSSDPETRIIFGGLLFSHAKWLTFWTLVFLIQWWLFPHWLVASAAGMTTALQALPATVIALLAVILASVFVIAAQVVALYGPRAILIVFLDAWVIVLGTRALIITVLTLLAAARLPTNGKPSDATAAALATLVLAVCGLGVRTLWDLFAALMRFTAPRSFALVAAAKVFDLLVAGAAGLVGFRVAMFGEMMRAGLRRGDSTTVEAAVEGLRNLQRDYYRAVEANPTAATLHISGARRDTWAAEDINLAVARAAEEALKVGAPEADLDRIAMEHEGLALEASDQDADADALIFVEGITRLGVTSHQISAQTINIYSYAAMSLAHIEARAEGKGKQQVAVEALFGWALVVSYVTTHFGKLHPQLLSSAAALGVNPPIEDAASRFDDPAVTLKWANKLDGGPEAVLVHLAGIPELRAGRVPWEDADGG